MVNPAKRAKRKVGLSLITTIASLVMALVIGAAVLSIGQQQSVIEDKAQRIFDVAMPMVFEGTRMVRGLERLARDGESILWIDSAAERAARRQQLSSIEGDAALQGDTGTRALVADSFAMLDRNLAELAANTMSARTRSLARWEPVKLALINESEKIVAEVSIAASDEADSIVETAHTARYVVMIASAALTLVAAAFGLFLYFAFTGPILRLTRALREVNSDRKLSDDNIFIRELQVLNDAAIELAVAHRELEATRSQLEQMAHTDALTGLANRRMFELRGNEEFERGRRYPEQLGVVAFDIDHFKQINDRFGHDGGDAVLRALGRLLQAFHRSADLPIARVGGEEFTMLLPHGTLDAAGKTAERVRQAIEQCAVDMPDGEPIHFTASFGVASLRPDDADLRALLHRADLALYQAKQRGRNRVELSS